MANDNRNLSKAKLTSRETDYNEWYLDVAKRAELFEYSPTPGCIYFLPKAASLWETIKAHVNVLIDQKGVRNLYMPALIPMSFFEREKDHVEGFAPELAIVTHGGGKELEEKLAFRPTSETIFCDFFKGQLQSYRDLPLLYNQWANVLRWEKRTRPFLRTAEFHWQEGHTLHETSEEAYAFAQGIMNEVYIKTFQELLAIEGIAGVKSESEKFAGAEKTFTYEPMMSNGWALQICTSHVLGRGFMEQFDVKYLGRDGKIAYPAYTSWGMSTRSIGGLISSHSDDKGLVIPPRMSEYKAVLLPVYGSGEKTVIDAYVRSIAETVIGKSVETPVKGEYFRALSGENGKVLVDFRDARFGEKITDFELSGYPVAIAVGQKEIEAGLCTVVSRVTGEKSQVTVAEAGATVAKFLSEGQEELRRRSRERLETGVVACASMEEIGAALEAGKFALYEWDKNPAFEVEIKEKFKATTRCIPNKGQFTDALLTVKNPDNVAVIVARAF